MAAAIEKSSREPGRAGGADGLVVELVPGRRGAFEVSKDGALVYSKLSNGRFPTSNDEVISAL